MNKTALVAFAILAIPTISIGAGKIPVEMSWAEAEAYLKAEGYPVRAGRDPNSLRAEDGRRPSLVFTFSAPHAAEPAKCIYAFSGGAFDWRSNLSSLTGIPIAKVPKGSKFKVTVGKRKLPVRVEAGEAGLLIGTCD